MTQTTLSRSPSPANSTGKRTITVACLVDRHSDYGRDIALGVNRYAQEGAHRQWIVLHAPSKERRLWLAQHRWDGIITQNSSTDFLAWLQGQQRAAVNVSARFPQCALPTVVADNFAAGQLAAEHLLDNGLRRLAAIGLGPDQLHFCDLRVAGFVSRIKQEGLPCETAPSSWGLEHWARAAKTPEQPSAPRQWLCALPKPVGLFLATHTLVPLVVPLCLAAEIRIPGELAVIGADNDTIHYESMRPHVSSIALNGQAVGYEAARVLEQLLAGGKAPSKPILISRAEVVVRDSTQMKRSQQALVSQALDYINGHYHRPLYMEEIAANLGVSQRELRRLFVEKRGRSLLEEITRVRIAKAKKLLQTTRLPVAEVARRCGFERREYFASIFRRHTRQTPRAYRRRPG